MFALSIGLVWVMPLNFKLLISLLSDFCCLIKVNRRLFGRWNYDLINKCCFFFVFFFLLVFIFYFNITRKEGTYMIVRLSLLRKTILIPEYLAFMCVCVFVDGCISQF